MREASADLVRVSEFKELDRKSEKGRENGGFQPPVFANVQFYYLVFPEVGVNRMFVEGASPSTHIRSRFPLHPSLSAVDGASIEGKVPQRIFPRDYRQPFQVSPDVF